MKTMTDIYREVYRLADRYREEVREIGYSENMGDKYIRSLDTFIGDIFDYPYDNRLTIQFWKKILFDIVINPIGEFR